LITASRLVEIIAIGIMWQIGLNRHVPRDYSTALSVLGEYRPPCSTRGFLGTGDTGKYQRSHRSGRKVETRIWPDQEKSAAHLLPPAVI
jgi:hypothetical protein